MDENILTGDLFMKDSDRIRKGSKSKIIYKGEAFRVIINEEISNLEIYKSILDEIEKFNKKELKNRYIYMHLFESVGKYLNWKKLFNAFK